MCNNLESTDTMRNEPENHCSHGRVKSARKFPFAEASGQMHWLAIAEEVVRALQECSFQPFFFLEPALCNGALKCMFSLDPCIRVKVLRQLGRTLAASGSSVGVRLGKILASRHSYIALEILLSPRHQQFQRLLSLESTANSLLHECVASLGQAILRHNLQPLQPSCCSEKKRRPSGPTSRTETNYEACLPQLRGRPRNRSLEMSCMA